MAARLGVAERDRIIRETWWLLMLQGVLAVFFGVVAVFWPSLTLVTLVYLTSAFVLAWGLVEIVRGLMSIRGDGGWWLTLLFGLVGLGVGIFLIRHPHVTFTTFIIVLGITLIVRGIIDFLAGLLGAGAQGASRVLLFFVGIAALVAGIAVLLEPASGGVAFVWILGLYALIFGVLTIVASLEFHRAVIAALEE